MKNKSLIKKTQLKAQALSHSLSNDETYEKMSLCLRCKAWKGLCLETDSGYLKWLGMWLHGAASNLCWEGQTPCGSDCGSWYVSKNRQPASHPFLLFLILCSSQQTLISVCLQKEAIIESEGRAHLLLINPHQIIRWLTASECDSHVG